MSNLKHFSIFVIVMLLFILSGCVSKKKHLAAIQSLRATNEKVVDDWQQKFNQKRRQLDSADTKIYNLELNLAERKGENNILIGLRNELQTQIESMESQMTNLGSSSKSTEQGLKEKIQKKETEINSLKLKLASINTVLDKNKQLLDRISADLSFEIQSLNQEDAFVITKLDQVILILPENYIFKKGSSSRMNDSGIELLEKINTVLNRYPQMLFEVIGHTDSTPANVKKYKDNWNFSVLQAASVVRTFVDDFGASPSQIIASGKGEFAPRSSNSTNEGKKENRRIEIIIYRPAEDLAKEIKKVTTSNP